MTQGETPLDSSGQASASDANLWHEDYPLELLLGQLLRQLAQSQRIDKDQAARLCLTPCELAGLIPDEVKVDHARYTADSLAVFLDEEGIAKPLAGAIRDWKASIELIRSRFGWLELPPAMRSRAHQRARVLIDQAITQGWLVEDGEQWRLTDAGKVAAIQAQG